MAQTGPGRAQVLEMVAEQDVRSVRLWFTDIMGFLKSFEVTIGELERALDEGMGFDGSSIQGYARIAESDMIARPDPSTFVILPKADGTRGRAARMFCDILNPDGSGYVGDPRGALKRNLAKAAELGFTFNVGPELEYFYFKNARGTEFLDSGGYFDLTPLDLAANWRQDTVEALQSLGIDVEFSHHEVAPSQHEIDLRYSDALTMADTTMTYRLIVKEIALKHNIYATFMPKPVFGKNGNGMHTHQSLFRGERNAFFNPADEYHLSDIAKHYIAGMLRHAPEICSLVAQWVNSYKRLVPGYEAPIHITWARRNRSALVRVPMYKPGKEKATRLEFRCPDPACNPYLAFSVMLAAGLKGIEEKYPVPAPIEEDIYEMTEKQLRDNGIKSLPGSLGEAIACTEKSELVREALGEHIFERFIAGKKLEWAEYRSHVHQYEIEKYLPVL